MNRRTFIERGSMGSAALVTGFTIAGQAREKKLKIGLIGCGWYGMVITKAALEAGGVEVIGLCDVDTVHLDSSAQEMETLQGKSPRKFTDYREMLDMHGLEAVFIGTPPQWHALQFIAACEKGLDIYCEKPLAYDVREGLAMIEAAKKAGNIVQIGFQRRQSSTFKQANDMVRKGITGPIHQVGVQIHYAPNIPDTTIQEPPASLDWDAWCGPAPKLPYRPSIGHKAWRLEKEYGNGHLVDWGIHNIDITRTILDLGMPSACYSNGSLNAYIGKITTPDTLHAVMDFEGLPVVWQHRFWGTGDLHPQFNNGVFFYGEKATLFASDKKMVLLRAGKGEKQESIEVADNTMQLRHVANFLDAVRSKKPNIIECRIDDAFQSTAAVQLAMISHYTGARVEWDAARMEIKENPSASALLARNYRAGYQRP